MLLTGLSNSFADAAAWRAITGMGSGASNVPAIGLLAAWFVQRRRGLAAGIGVTGSSFALIVLGLFVPPVLDGYGWNGWRMCWFLFGGVTLGTAVFSFTILRNCPADLGLLPPRRSKRHLDSDCRGERTKLEQRLSVRGRMCSA
jgi:MFS family permease